MGTACPRSTLLLQFVQQRMTLCCTRGSAIITTAALHRACQGITNAHGQQKQHRWSSRLDQEEGLRAGSKHTSLPPFQPARQKNYPTSVYLPLLMCSSRHLHKAVSRLGASRLPHKNTIS